MWFIEPLQVNYQRGPEEFLSLFIKENILDGVIIATEPLFTRPMLIRHMKYQHSIDKPITARVDSTSKLSSADGILKDYIIFA